MSAERNALLMYKGAMTELPEDQRVRVRECADRLMAITKSYGLEGQMGAGLFALEYSVEVAEQGEK